MQHKRIPYLDESIVNGDAASFISLRSHLYNFRKRNAWIRRRTTDDGPLSPQKEGMSNSLSAASIRSYGLRVMPARMTGRTGVMVGYE